MPELWVSVTDANLNQQKQSSGRMNRTRVAVEPSVQDEDSSTLYSSLDKPAFVNAQWVVPACAANYSEEDFSAACPSLPQTRVGSPSAILAASPLHGLRNDDRRIEHHQSRRSINLQKKAQEAATLLSSSFLREKRWKLWTCYEYLWIYKRLQIWKKLNMKYMDAKHRNSRKLHGGIQPWHREDPSFLSQIEALAEVRYGHEFLLGIKRAPKRPILFNTY